MDNPFPLESLNQRGDDPSDDEEEEVWDIKANTLTKSEVFELIRDIKDPEHDYTLEALHVVRRRQILILPAEDNKFIIELEFTPTVPHCTLATTIGLCLREKLRRELPNAKKVTIKVTPGRHSTEAEINKQVNDKERVAAAMENPEIRRLVEGCLDPQALFNK